MKQLVTTLVVFFTIALVSGASKPASPVSLAGWVSDENCGAEHMQPTVPPLMIS